MTKRRILAVVPAEASFTHMTVNQRLRALAQLGQLELLSCYPKSFPEDIASEATVRAMPASSRLPRGTARLIAFAAEVALWCLAQKAVRRRYSLIYCFQDTSAVAGLLLRGSETAWVVDVLDDPALELHNAAAQGKRVKARALAIRDALFKAFVHRADLVFTIGSSVHDPLPHLLRLRYDVKQERMRHFRQALAINSFPPPSPMSSGRCCIFYVGWVSPLRGVDTLLAATRILWSSGRKVEVRLAGTVKNADHDWLVKAANDQDHGVQYLGLLPSERVLEEIQNASVCVCPFPDLPELRPVQPVKVLEYQALGRPVVASRLPGIRAVIEDGVTGLLVEPGSADDLADAVARLLDDPHLAQQLATKARQRLDAFDIEKVNGQLASALGPWL